MSKNYKIYRIHWEDGKTEDMKVNISKDGTRWLPPKTGLIRDFYDGKIGAGDTVKMELIEHNVKQNCSMAI
jgi:hypothetical protein